LKPTSLVSNTRPSIFGLIYFYILSNSFSVGTKGFKVNF